MGKEFLDQQKYLLNHYYLDVSRALWIQTFVESDIGLSFT